MYSYQTNSKNQPPRLTALTETTDVLNHSQETRLEYMIVRLNERTENVLLPDEFKEQPPRLTALTEKVWTTM